MLSYHGNDHYNSVRSIVVEDDCGDGKGKGIGDGGTEHSSPKHVANVSDIDERRTGVGCGSRGTVTSAAKGRPPVRGSACPCGSGRKYKKCCSARDKIEGRARRCGRYHEVPADAGGGGRGYTREEDDVNARRRGMAEEDEEEDDNEEETEKGGRWTGGGGKFIGSFKVLAI